MPPNSWGLAAANGERPEVAATGDLERIYSARHPCRATCPCLCDCLCLEAILDRIERLTDAEIDANMRRWSAAEWLEVISAVARAGRGR
jgi:hypothetical protein